MTPADREGLDSARWSVLKAALADAADAVEPRSFPQHILRALDADAEANRYGALCALGLRRLGVAGSGEDNREQAALFASIMLQSHADRLAAALDEASIPHAFLKGLVSDVAYYGARGLRETSDIDVLVDPDAVHRAEIALEKLGAYRFAFPGAQHTSARSHGHVYAWPRSPQRSAPVRAEEAAPLVIDLHIRLTDPPLRDFSTRALAGRGDCRGPDGATRMGLSPGFQLAYAAANLAIDGLSGRIKQAMDAAQIVRHAPAAVAVAAVVARDAGAGAALFGLLRLIEARLGAQIDQPALRTIMPGAQKRKFTEALFGVYAAPLSWRGMPTRLLLPDHGAANAKATVRWGLLRALDAADAVSRKIAKR